MNHGILSCINDEKVCVFSIEMMDGSPHAATVHFAYDEQSGLFLFETNKEYRKAEPLQGRNESRASLVIGTSENSDKTFQLDGVTSLSHDERLIHVYLKKFPNKAKKFEDKKLIFFIFKPTWWRFTDFSGEEKKILTSAKS